MPKFLIRLHGENYKIKIEKRDFLFRKRSEWKDVGFYTTRFVESETANEAIEKALEMVRKELEEIAVSNQNSNLTFDEIEEDEEAFDLYAPEAGFTFYVESDDLINDNV